MIWKARSRYGSRRISGTFLLAERVQKGRTLGPAEAKLAADLIMGRIKRPRHRPRALRTWQRDEAIHNFVSIYRAKVSPKIESATEAAMKKFNIGRSTVRDALEKVEKHRRALNDGKLGQ